MTDEPARPDREAWGTIERVPSSPGVRALGAVLVVAATTGAAALAESLFALPDVAMLFLVAVLVCAVFLGRGPSLLAAAAGVAAYDFFFVPPRWTFAIGDDRYILTFAVMFAVSLMVSSLATRLRRQEAAAQVREERTRTLYGLTQDLGAATTARDIAVVAARTASEVFGARAWMIGADAAPVVAAHPVIRTVLDDDELAVARWALENATPAGHGTEAFPDATVVAVPVGLGANAQAALVLRRTGRLRMDADHRAFLDTFARQVAIALSRAELDERARQADVRSRTEEMRSALLSSVSHDLRTPLAAITGSASALRDDPGLPSNTREEMLATICEQSERLERLVSNLLDMTRLQSGAVTPKREWLPIDEVIGAALTRIEPLLNGRRVQVRVPDDATLVSLDPVLTEQLLVNLLENAVKHTPRGTPIDVRASVEEGSLTIEIRDRGGGITKGDEQRIFERFVRGASAEAPGAGLGLSICRAIAGAHDGALTARNRADGGAVFTVTIPMPPAPPDPAAASPERPVAQAAR